MHGTVISVLISQLNSRLPTSHSAASPYIIWLVDGSIHHVSSNAMEQIFMPSLNPSNKLRFPSWFSNNQNVAIIRM
jgi:hypothetical protein